MDEKLSKISEQLEIFRNEGGKIYVCPVAIAFHNLTVNDLISNIDGIRGLVDFSSRCKGRNTNICLKNLQILI